jgi:hypothetical protein
MVFKKSAARTAWESLARIWVSLVVHVVYPSTVFLTLLWAGAKADLEHEKVLIAYIALCVYVALLIALNAHYTLRYARKARYAEAMVSVHAAIHCIRDAGWYLDKCIWKEEKYSDDHLKDMLRPCTDAVAQAFSLVTGKTNRVFIKRLCSVEGQGVEGNYLETFCRDSVSAAANRDMDRNEGYQHTIYKNTAFRHIISRGQRYFFSNDVLAMNDYESTFQELFPDKKLPYRARIVFPIRYVRTEREMAPNIDANTKEEGRKSVMKAKIVTAGFLGVDTKSPNAYEEAGDVELGLAIADALFPILKRSWVIQGMIPSVDGEAHDAMPIPAAEK